VRPFPRPRHVLHRRGSLLQTTGMCSVDAPIQANCLTGWK
jgi:hypothetical protein